MIRKDFYSKSIERKLLSIFIIATFTVGISWGLTRIAFKRVVDSMEEISQPNEKIRLVNNLSYSLTNIVQFQRKQLTDLKKENEIQYPDNQYLINTLDTLRSYCENNELLLEKIDLMEVIIKDYDSFLSNYLKLYSDFTDFRNLSSKYHSLIDYVSEIYSEIDSSIITTETIIATETTTTTTMNPGEPDIGNEEEKLSFFQRIFGRKIQDEMLTPPQTIQHTETIVKEESTIRVDTLTIAQREEIVRDILESVNRIDHYHKLKSKELADSERILIHNTSFYIDQLRDLLRSIEEEEIIRVTANNTILVKSVNNSMLRITIIMFLFVILSILMAFLIFSDISESNRYRKELVTAKEQAEHLGKVKQRYLTNMSHQIRTPLQSIVGFSEQIVQQEYPNKKAIQIIFNSSRHLIKVVNEVLDFSSISSGKFILEQKEFNMYDLLNEVAEMIGLQASQKNIRFQFNNTTNQESFYIGDPFRLKQILYNLLGNAVKFTYQGSVSLVVNAVKRSSETEFNFQISDTGIGISEKDIKVIFNEFAKAGTSNYNNNGGTGLGLSITRSLIELHKGTITASSVEGKGSTFTFNIKYENVIKHHNKDLNQPVISNLAFKGKIMVIDDDVYILKLCSDIFNKFNISHTCYSSPAEVLKNWSDEFSLVLMDIRMPEMNGFELSKQLREKSGENLRIVALSAQDLKEERNDVKLNGFDQMILKPFSESDLLTLVHSSSRSDGFNVDSLGKSPLARMSMGDTELLTNNLKTFLSETKGDISHLQRLVYQNNIHETIEVLHKLSGRVGQIGAGSLSMKLHSMEEGIKKSNTITRNNPVLQEIIDEMESLLEIVETVAGT